MGLYRPDLETPLYDMIYTLLSEVKFYVQKVEDVIISTQLIESKLDDIKGDLVLIQQNTFQTNTLLNSDVVPLLDDMKTSLISIDQDLSGINTQIDSVLEDGAGTDEIRTKVIP